MTSTSEFYAQPTAIDGLITIDSTRIEDERGWFQEKFHAEKLHELGIAEDFHVVQTSIAFNRRGSTRGFHAEPWSKFISLIDGKAFSAFVDLRTGPAFGRVVEIEFSPRRSIFVPPGVANSYQCLTDLHYLYSVDQHWSPEIHDSQSFVNLADPHLGVNWPIPLDEAIISDRDRNHPLLAEFVARTSC